MTPQSIRWFERFYFSGLAISFLLLGTDGEFLESFDFGWQSPDVVVTAITMLLAVTVSLLLWHFVVRHRSKVAKWLVVVFAILSVGTVFLPGEETESVVWRTLEFVEVAFNVSAALCLFFSGAQRWFRHERSDLWETFS